MKNKNEKLLKEGGMGGGQVLFRNLKTSAIKIVCVTTVVRAYIFPWEACFIQSTIVDFLLVILSH
jgi:hypothetical protein